MCNDGSDNEMSKIFDLMAEKLPKIMKVLTDSFFSEEAGKKIGKAVGAMYKELIEAGIPQDKALDLAKDYMNMAKDLSCNSMDTN